MCLINYMEMSRVTGVPFDYLLARGQQIKVVSQLYRKAITEDLVIPAMEVQGMLTMLFLPCSEIPTPICRKCWWRSRRIRRCHSY